MKRLRRRLRVKWSAYRIRRQLEWERLHVTRHPDGNTSVHGASMRAVIRWYNRQDWPREYGPELPAHLRRPQL